MLEKLVELAHVNRVVRVEGSNGSGKSTLLMQYQLRLAREGVEYGVLSQHDSVFEELTAEELYLVANKPDGLHWLEKLGGSLAAKKQLALMSSGEKSKALISLALCFDVVVLDEPLAHLDRLSRENLEAVVSASRSRFVIANHESGAFKEAIGLNLDHYESR